MRKKMHPIIENTFFGVYPFRSIELPNIGCGA